MNPLPASPAPVDSAPHTATWQVDTELRVVAYHGRRGLLGGEKTLVGRLLQELFAQTNAAALSAHRAVLSGQGSAAYEQQIDGQDYLICLEPIAGGVQGTAMDITAYKTAEHTTALLKRHRDAILEAAGEGIYGLNMRGEATFVNPAAVAMTGWSAEETIGENIHYKHHNHRADGSHYPHEECPIYAAIRDGEVHHVDDEVFWRKDGSCFPVEYTSTPMYQDGTLTGAVVVFKDISERKRAEEALRKAFQEVEQLKERLQEQNTYLQEEIRQDHNFGEIIGASPAVRGMLRQIDQVAATDARVLILGESGTGKELVARAIHQHSNRRDKPLIKVNCGAISAGLVESELFGHEKGAYTGALNQRKGRFELADGGTLFLDEVGELPLETQVKLLRALQEQEIERVGGNTPISIDVRVIAATNRDLAQQVREGRFRQDLFYRLNLFPIEVPPLRERNGDLRVLAQFFAERAARKFGKEVRGISADSLQALEHYSWPGNIRELQNLIERAVILAGGPVLQLAALVPADAAPAQDEALPTLEALERAHIIRVLQKTRGTIAGPNGAAVLLGLHPNTLRSRMLKLGIRF